MKSLRIGNRHSQSLSGGSLEKVQTLEIRLLPAASSVSLANLNGTNGATFYGTAMNELAGQSLSGVGDVNADGFSDFLIGAEGTGNSYLVFGKADWSGTPSTLLSSLNGTTGVQIVKVAINGGVNSVSAAGDVNNDGFDDFVIGNPAGKGPGNNQNLLGETYLVFGKADWSGSSTFSLSTLNGTNGVIFYGVDAGDTSGSTVGPAGDVNNDGFDDFLIGAPNGQGSSNSQTSTGEAYLVFGKSNWSASPTVSLSTLDGTSGVTLYGVDNLDDAGKYLGTAGDVNGDGFDDIVISAPLADGPGNDQGTTGEAYLVFGKSNWVPTPTILLGNLNGSNGLVIYGVDNLDSAGSGSFHTVGDFNGDGFDDITLGADSANTSTTTGTAYVIFGKSNWSSTFLLSSLNGTNGLAFYGELGGNAGYSVDFAGDVNGDGYSDLLIGAPFMSGPVLQNSLHRGEAYLVYGKSNWALTPGLNLSALNGSNGFALTGIDREDFAGFRVSGAGDINDDGFDDLLISADHADGLGNLTEDAGEAYIVFGFDTANPLIDQIGVKRNAQFYQDLNNSFSHNSGDRTFFFGNASDIPLVGDWNNDGIDNIGVFRNGSWYLDLNGNNIWDGNSGGDIVFTFGNPTDTPLIGDWNGDGIDDVGVKRGDVYYLDANGNRAWNGTGGGDSLFDFGNASDTPVVGDWNGNGHDKIGVFRSGTFYLDQNGNGAWNDTTGGDSRFGYGMAGDKPIIGDWNGDGISDVGIVRGNSWYLDQNGNRAWNGTLGGDALFTYGNDNDTPLVGNWTTPSPSPKPKSTPKPASPTRLDHLFAQLAPPTKKTS